MERKAHSHPLVVRILAIALAVLLAGGTVAGILIYLLNT